MSISDRFVDITTGFPADYSLLSGRLVDLHNPGGESGVQLGAGFQVKNTAGGCTHRYYTPYETWGSKEVATELIRSFEERLDVKDRLQRWDQDIPSDTKMEFKLTLLAGWAGTLVSAARRLSAEDPNVRSRDSLQEDDLMGMQDDRSLRILGELLLPAEDGEGYIKDKDHWLNSSTAVGPGTWYRPNGEESGRGIHVVPTFTFMLRPNGHRRWDFTEYKFSQGFTDGPAPVWAHVTEGPTREQYYAWGDRITRGTAPEIFKALSGYADVLNHGLEAELGMYGLALVTEWGPYKSDTGDQEEPKLLDE
jgi:hypothetical protein